MFNLPKNSFSSFSPISTQKVEPIKEQPNDKEHIHKTLNLSQQQLDSLEALNSLRSTQHNPEKIHFEPEEKSKRQANLPPGDYLHYTIFRSTLPDYSQDHNKRDHPLNISVLQFRLINQMDQLMNPYQYKNNIEPLKRQSTELAGQGGQGGANQAATPSVAKDIDYQNVFTNAVSNTYNIPTAKKYFVPLKTAQITDISEQEMSAEHISSLPNVQRQSASSKSFGAEPLALRGITGEYNYLFQSASPSAISFSPAQQNAITITSEQLLSYQPPTLMMDHTTCSNNNPETMKFRIHRDGYGAIDFLTFTITDMKDKWEDELKMTFKRIFTFEHKKIIIKEHWAEKKKFELDNQPAYITIENILPPRDSTDITEFVEQLKQECKHKNVTFIHYSNPTLMIYTPGFDKSHQLDFTRL